MRRAAAPTESSTSPELPLAPPPAVPLAPSAVVTRARLLARLTEGSSGPLTLVSAQAGSGKTLLASHWARLGLAPGQLAWITVEDGDADADVFWPWLIECLCRQGVTVDAPDDHRSADSHGLVGQLARTIAQRCEPLVIVIDEGCQSIDSQLGRQWDYLLRHSGAKLRVIWLTRADPAMPLHRYRLDGTVVEVRAADLAFTVAELADLAAAFELELTAAERRALLERTAGWPAGLTFAVMSLAGQTDIEQAIDEFTGTQSNVAAYLVSEVLDAQPPEIREILLRTSVAAQLPPGLVEALTGQPPGQRVLEFMARGNSFIEPVRGAPGTYRYQPLLREFLRMQLAYEQPALVPELHKRAAYWLAAEGRVVDAIRHAAEAGAWADAAAYLVEDAGIGQLLTGPSKARLGAIFARMPATESGTSASIVRAALAGQLPATRPQRSGSGSGSGLIVEPLTPKEQEVLVHLAALLTTGEIADRMTISVNTVRTHVRTILRKLGASRRNEAIRRAWALGLLPADT